ncbi:Metal binding domain of Ada [Dyella sp. OK004]|uniref:Ada metal-binding domain-containing protein n=1 Tax=Dyella sp. OK004 TaxID=1855292 RepID=UPI0008F0D5B0|nr:Ada metal-binding domain-containing protein [Dyella sp. OK004]SFR96010.1 Metal binding domain of Ada [Dyella sp. OK004]
MAGTKTWILIGRDGKPYTSDVPGMFGGHRGSKVYGRLDCRAALQAIARGGYVAHRVFFPDEDTAQVAGYRPCAVCLPEPYAVWKGEQPLKPPMKRYRT